MAVAAVALCLVAAGLIVWHFLAFHMAGGKRPPAVTRSFNALCVDGNDIAFFSGVGRDSTLEGLSLVSDGILCAPPVTLPGPTLRSVVRHSKDSLMRRIAYLEAAIEEMQYYKSVHGVQDEGFDMVASHATATGREVVAIRQLLDALEAINGRSRLGVRHVEEPVQPDSAAATHSVLFVCNGGAWQDGRWLRSPKAGPGVAVDTAGRVVAGIWEADTLVSGSRTDCGGEYVGQFDRRMRASGHGHYAMHDISRYQHGRGRRYYPIHWRQLRITDLGRLSKKDISGQVDYPVSFVYIKSTEGSTIRNRFYRADYLQARRNGIRCGAYHFFSVRSTARAQARHFLRNSYFRSGDLPPVLDVEPTDRQIAQIGGIDELFRRVRTWMNIVRRRTGVRPILYVNQRFVNKYLGLAPDIKQNYNVWIARYGEYKPDIKLVFWQLSPDGRVSGIHGDVDINVFNGYQEQFDRFLETELFK